MPPLNPTLPTVNPASAVCVKLVLEGRLLAQQIVNTFYYTAPNPSADITPPVLAALCDKFIDVVVEQLTDCMQEDVSLDSVTAFNLTLPDIASHVEAIPGAEGGGARTGDPLPPQNAINIVRRTAVAGRHGRGSIRLAGISEDDQTAGELTAAGLLTDLATLTGTTLLAVLSPVVGATTYNFTPALASTTGGPTPTVKAAPITSWQADLEISSQNSRKFGRGA